LERPEDIPAPEAAENIQEIYEKEIKVTVSRVNQTTEIERKHNLLEEKREMRPHWGFGLLRGHFPSWSFIQPDYLATDLRLQRGGKQGGRSNSPLLSRKEGNPSIPAAPRVVRFMMLCRGGVCWGGCFITKKSTRSAPRPKGGVFSVVFLLRGARQA